MRKFAGLALALVFLVNSAFVVNAQLYGYMRNINPANPTGTTSLTGVHMGLGAAANACIMAVQKSGVVLILWNFTSVNGTVGDGALTQIRYGTGTAPANAAAPTGTAVGIFQGDSNGGTVQEAQSQSAIISGLTIGSTYWFDLVLEAVTGGTASLTNVTCSGIELAN